MTRITIGLFLLASCLLSNLVRAQSKVQGVLINADRSFRDVDNETVELEGKVQVIFQNNHLTAERAKLDLGSKTLEAEGDVLVVTPLLTYGGRRIKVNYETNTGLIIDGYVLSGSVLVEGDYLQKVGEKEFLADNARYTTCENCPETWSFSGTRVRAEMGGYAFIKNSTLRFGSVPVFWLPYMAVPLKSDRTTGLLTPYYENTSDSGFIFSQPFFWVMSRSQDSTWTFRNYEFRGQKILTNYRYMLTEKSYGELDAALMQDRSFSTSERFNIYRPPEKRNAQQNRWFFRYNHYYDLPEGFVNRVQLNTTSDLQYPIDFPRETMSSSEGWLENRVSVTKNTSDQHWSLDSSYYTNLLQSDPVSTNNDSVHRLPDFRWSITPQRIADSSFFASTDFRYTSFARGGFSYDEMNTATSNLSANDQRRLNSIGDKEICSTSNWESDQSCRYFRTGRYDSEKDLIRSGQRGDWTVSLIRPLNYAALDFLPKVSYRETQYLFDVGRQRTNVRRYLRTEFSTRTSFSVLFDGEMDEDQMIKYKHEIQPEVTYSTIPWIDHPPHPFFGGYSSADIPAYLQENISDSDLNSPYGVQFDYEDRVLDRKILTYGMTNKLVRKQTKPSGESTYAQLASWKLAQNYDMFQVESRDPLAQPYSDILSELAINLASSELYQRANYYPYHHVTNTSTRVRIFNARSESISLAHNLSYGIVRGKPVNYEARSEELVLGAKKIYRLFDFILAGAYDLNPINTRRIKSYGYAVQFRLPGNCWYLTWYQYQNAQGNFGWHVKFDFSWDGKPNPSLREDALSTVGSSSWYSPSAF